MRFLHISITSLSLFVLSAAALSVSHLDLTSTTTGVTPTQPECQSFNPPNTPISSIARRQHRNNWARLFYYMSNSVVFAIVPIAATSAALYRLYTEVLDNTLTIWAKKPPLNQVVVEFGAFRLEFGCSMQPVPWEFITQFADSTRDCVNRGFSVNFERQWWYEKANSSRICYAGLRTVAEGQTIQPPRSTPSAVG